MKQRWLWMDENPALAARYSPTNFGFQMELDRRRAYARAREGHTDAIVQNNAEALQYNQDADTPCALNYAGICYANGRGVIKSASGAAAKYREAAVRGDANAQFNLGCMYKTCAYGPGAVQDDPTEQRWCRLVGHGSIESLREDGYGAEQDVPLAIRFAARWFGLAASQGHAGAQASTDLLLGEGHSLEQDVPWLCGGVEQNVPSWQHCNPSWEYRCWSHSLY